MTPSKEAAVETVYRKRTIETYFSTKLSFFQPLIETAGKIIVSGEGALLEAFKNGVLYEGKEWRQ